MARAVRAVSIVRVALLILALAGFAVFAVALLYTASPKMTEGETTQYARQVLGQAVGTLRDELERYEDISFQFVANRDLNALLVDYVGMEDTYEVSRHNQAFSNFLEGYAFGDGGICDALFLDESNARRKALTMGELVSAGFIRSFRGSEAYRSIAAADGRPVWLGPVRLNRQDRHYVMLGRRIKHLFTGRPLGVLVMFIDADHLSRLVTEYLDGNFYFSIGTVRTRYTMILDGNGNIVASPTVENIGRSAAEILHDSGQLKVLYKKGAGSFIGRIGDAPVLVVHEPIPGTSWRLAIPITPRAGLTRGKFLPEMARNVLAALVVLGFLTVAWLALKSARTIGLPGAPSAELAAAGSGLRVSLGQAVSPPESLASHAWGANLRSGDACVSAPASQGAPSWRVPVDQGSEASAEKGHGLANAPWLDELTEREKQILSLLAQGYSNKEIAQAIHVAEQTVKNYVSVIYCKMGVRDRVQASLKAVEAGLHRSSAAGSADGADNAVSH